MLVSDVYADAREVLGYCSQEKTFSRLTDAIETLANKGPWEPLLAYLDIPVQEDQLITLPDSVLVPLRVNLNDNPSFPRDRVYEFTMNGPGLNDPNVDWSWYDQGETQNVDPVTGAVTRSSQRIIKISRAGVSVRMLVRLRTTKVTDMEQFIPLNSKMAILLMLKALESYRRGSPQDFQLGQVQEEQALKFLKDEQSTRNLFSEISRAIDASPIVGYNYHANNAIIVSDIYDDAAAICGGIGKQHVLDRISEAVEVLANKGQWDGMTAYLDIIPVAATTSARSGTIGDTLALPRQVEIPLKININKQPSVSRFRMFEFSLMGPGSNFSDIDYLTWVDQGTVYTQFPFIYSSRVKVVASIGDRDKQVEIWGIDDNDQEVRETITIRGAELTQPPITVTIGNVVFKSITRIRKDVTGFPITLTDASDSLLSLIYPDETEPMYRQIKLNKAAHEVKIMFRKASLKITSVHDMIPLKSRMAILLMLRSISLLKAPALTPETMQAAQALDTMAEKLLKEEETSRLGYIDASQREVLPAMGGNTNARNVILVKDVYDDACDIFGPCGRIGAFTGITDAMEMLSNKSQWSGLEGYVDLIVDQRGYVTLPRKVEIPIAINFYKSPSIMRNKWYEFHVDGFGGYDSGTGGAYQGDGMFDCGHGGFWDDRAEYPLLIEPSAPVRMFAATSFSGDLTTRIRAYGYDAAGNWIRSYDAGEIVDGEALPLVYIPPPEDEIHPPPAPTDPPASTNAATGASTQSVTPSIIYPTPTEPPLPPKFVPTPPSYNCNWPFKVVITNTNVITTTTEIATFLPIIIYTLDGSEPTWTNGVHSDLDAVTIELIGETTIKAIVARQSYDVSPVAIGFYTDQQQPVVNPPFPPHMNPVGGYDLTFPIQVSIDVASPAPASAIAQYIIYTVNDTEPTWTNGTHVGEHVTITISSNTTLKARVARDADNMSSVTTEKYSSSPQVPPPPPPPPPPAPERLGTLHYFEQITRITKDECSMPLAILGFPSDTDHNELLGTYEADETEPMYRRIRLPKWVKWVRMRYRMNTLNVNKMDDVLNLKSRTALITAMRAIKALQDGDVDKSEALEKKAVQLISEEEMSRNPSQTFDLQFDQAISWADPLQGRVR